MSDSNGRIHLLGDHRAVSKIAKTDDQGRVLKHNATIEDVHRIVIEECDKVHQFYLGQIPPHVARMIQDALLAYGLIRLDPNLDIKPVEAEVAQPAEQLPRNEQVDGSSPSLSSEGSDVPPDNADIVTAFHPPLETSEGAT